MSLLAWLGVAYGAVALFALRPLAGHFAWQMQTKGQPDWVNGTSKAICVLMVGPLVVCGIALHRWTPKIGAEREAELKAREERLREAEKELGL